jgi:hypothetical protein
VEDVMTNLERRRPRRGAALHGIAVAVFAMLALSGAGAAAQGLYGLAVPFVVAGTAGGVGAAVIAVTLWREQRREAGAAATERSEAPQRTVRLAMGAAAVVVLMAGVVLAPGGVDRGFVITVAALLAAALALFALLAGDRPRTVERLSTARDPH